MFSNIQNEVNKYAARLDEIKLFAQKVKNKMSSNSIKGFVEEEQLQEIKYNSKGTVIGCDSGFFESSLTGLDFVYVKTAGSYMEYDSKLIKYEKLINPPRYKPLVSKNILQKEDVQKFTSISRLREELYLLYKGLKEKNPEYALIDGNVLPQAIDRPQNKSVLYSEYENLLQDFVKIYDYCNANNIFLLGSVEDSRANSFIKLLDFDKQSINSINDVLFLNYVLEKNYCTSFFPIFATESNRIYSDLKQYGDFNFFATYIKVNEDYPLRLELLQNNYSQTKLKEIKGFISYISKYAKDYCYPSVLLDADKQAKLTQNEISFVKDIIESYMLEHGIKALRRNRRI